MEKEQEHPLPAAAPPVPAAAPTPSPDNCWVTLAHVESLDTLSAALPDFKRNHRWEIHRSPFGNADRIGVIRCIQGASLRMDCDMHKGQGSSSSSTRGRAAWTCKLHVDINDIARLLFKGYRLCSRPLGKAENPARAGEGAAGCRRQAAGSGPEHSQPQAAGSRQQQSQQHQQQHHQHAKGQGQQQLQAWGGAAAAAAAGAAACRARRRNARCLDKGICRGKAME